MSADGPDPQPDMAERIAALIARDPAGTFWILAKHRCLTHGMTKHLRDNRRHLAKLAAKR